MRKFKKNATIGFKHGSQHGYDKGYHDGFAKGFEVAKQVRRMPFAGTSIIIPTYNHLQYLRECIESIRAFTSSPYEIIVVDNGSTDGTAQYLQSHADQLVFKLNTTNLGFAGAVNQGLYMARGTTLLILNNDAVVTTSWLDNLLHCVNSDPSVGIVGPVTNYISGEQLIDVTYNDMAAMQQFAQHFNHRNDHLWVDTERLTGFCMLMRREVFTRLGYFDEGFEIGNCEDDDIGLRARLLGLRLTIAKDTFIHHYGSVSMKALQAQFDPIYEKNLAYYSSKWEDPQLAINLVTHDAITQSIDLYPSHVVVKGAGSSVYWVEKGRRYHIIDGEAIDAVRLSSLDLQCWPIEGSITMEDYWQRLNQVCEAQQAGQWVDGVIVNMAGKKFQICDHYLRRIISDHAYEVWFSQRPKALIEVKVSKKYEEGNPVIAPIIIKSEHI